MTRLPSQLEALAKMLTYILCHRPDEFGLVLDAEGFVSIKQLLAALGSEPGWGHIRRHHLDQTAALSQSPRLEILADKIRSVAPKPAALRRPPGEAPPALLYAAVPPKAHAVVVEHGLRPPIGQEIVLAVTPEIALKLGKRRSPEPVLITVQARAAARAGVAFQPYGENLFLSSSAVPQEFVQAPPLPKVPEKPKPKPKPAKEDFPLPPAGALAVDFAEMMKKAGKAGRKKDEPAWKAATRKERRKRRS
ncbi:MAG: RNA 2'-phosphotransferase [Deltaproteobacteria bacterium]|nr:RNA 2'-phosphotransferase [Deltaproteobacteria bacterium]